MADALDLLIRLPQPEPSPAEAAVSRALVGLIA